MPSQMLISRPYKAVLALTLLFSIIGLPLASSLLSHYGSRMPGDALDNVVIQTLFAMCWSTLFSMLMLGGLFLAPRLFGGLLSQWTVFFLSFLQLLVASGTLVVELSKVTCSASRCAVVGPAGCIESRCSTFHALEAITWVATWLTFALLMLIVWDWFVYGSDTRSKDSKRLQKEMTRHSTMMSARSNGSRENGV